MTAAQGDSTPSNSQRDPRRRQWGARLGLALAVVAVLVAVGLVGARLLRTSDRPVAAPPPPAAPEAPAASPVTLPAPGPVPVRTTIARVSGAIPYSDEPGKPAIGSIPIGSWWGTTKFLPVIDEVPGFLQVRLPQRPNGLTGWIPASSAQLSVTDYAILVDVTNRRLQLYEQGRRLLDLPAGVGTPRDPTPLGQFYVMDIAESPSAGYGPFILDTNAHSESITSWEGSGDAFTAIHGPLGLDGAIGTTGAAISHGCIRLHDADLAQLAGVPAGAPVVIVA